MRVKLAWLVRVGGARPPPFTTITITSKVAVYAPAEWADTLTLFHLYQYMYSVALCFPHNWKEEKRVGGFPVSRVRRRWLVHCWYSQPGPCNLQYTVVCSDYLLYCKRSWTFVYFGNFSHCSPETVLLNF